MTDTTDTTTAESIDRDDQQAVSQQTKTATEFFYEKFAEEEESEPVWIDPKGDPEDLSKHCFVAGQTGAGKSVHIAGLLDEENANDVEEEAEA
jgi:type IV secretory pathway VirB4 component